MRLGATSCVSPPEESFEFVEGFFAEFLGPFGFGAAEAVGELVQRALEVSAEERAEPVEDRAGVEGELERLLLAFGPAEEEPPVMVGVKPPGNETVFVPARVFGVLMSLEPARRPLTGFVVLGELLGAREIAAVGLVVVASAGAARSAGTRRRCWISLRLSASRPLRLAAQIGPPFPVGQRSRSGARYSLDHEVGCQILIEVGEYVGLHLVNDLCHRPGVREVVDKTGVDL